jgi:hypothetical protein
MCVIDELIRSEATGKTLVDGWYATGTVDYFASGLIDCKGFTDSTSTPVGAIYSSTVGFSYSNCDASHPILCCD